MVSTEESALAAAEQHRQQKSQVAEVLAGAQRDLQHAELPLKVVANPVRDVVVQPLLHLAGCVLPPAATRVPFGDAIAAFCLEIPCAAARTAYGLVHGDGGSVVDANQRRRELHDIKPGAFVAREIMNNCERFSPSELNERFMKEQDGSFTFRDVMVTASDGAELFATVLEPVGRRGFAAVADGRQKLPMVLFVNSWSCAEHEYIVLAAELAKRGYIALSYCTRGFGKSGGLVNVAGPSDQEDMGAVLDWAEANTRVDVTNIGICGISYGGGLSLIGAGTQSRIKTAAALAGWGDIAASLYGDETPRAVWAAFLLTSGYLTGELDPAVKEKLVGLLNHEDIDGILEWASHRSAITFIDNINASGKPIYMAQSFGDDLFNPNQAFDFFERLTGPKRMDYSQGIHGTPEMFGMLGTPNYVWENTFRWFDYHLKGIDNGIMDEQVTMELKLNSHRERFKSWPSFKFFNRMFHLRPRGLFSGGELSLAAPGSDEALGTTTISALGIGSTSVSGIPIVSNFVEAHLHQPIPNLLGLNRFRSVAYLSEPLKEPLKIRGRVRLNLVLSSSVDKTQVVGYLYDCPLSRNVGRLISHGVATKHEMAPNEETPVMVNIQAAAYDVSAGHRLAVAIDTRDPLYASPPGLGFYKLTIHHQHSSLELQCLEN